MRKNTESSAGVDEVTPIFTVVFDMDQLAGGDGVERPPGNQFPCQEQAASHLVALSPKFQW